MGCESNGDKESAVTKLWYVGVILSIFGSVATNMGVNMQKYSFMSEAKRCIKLKRGYFRQPLWVFGLALVIGGSGLDFVALGFLPQSLATPVGGSTMVANVVFASLFLKEKFSRMDALGTALVLIGICIVAAFAEKESSCYTVDELVSLYSEPLFVMYIIVMGLSCVGLYLLAKKMEQLLRVYGSSSLRYKRYARVSPILHLARNWNSLSTLLHNTLISLSFCLGGLAAPALLPGALGGLWRAVDPLCEIRRGARQDERRRHEPVCEFRHLRDLAQHVRLHLPPDPLARARLAVLRRRVRCAGVPVLLHLGLDLWRRRLLQRVRENIHPSTRDVLLRRVRDAQRRLLALEARDERAAPVGQVPRRGQDDHLHQARVEGTEHRAPVGGPAALQVLARAVADHQMRQGADVDTQGHVASDLQGIRDARGRPAIPAIGGGHDDHGQQQLRQDRDRVLGARERGRQHEPQDRAGLVQFADRARVHAKLGHQVIRSIMTFPFDSAENW